MNSSSNSKDGHHLPFGSQDFQFLSSRKQDNQFSISEFIWGRHFALLRERKLDASFRQDFWQFNEDNESLCALLVAYISFTVIQGPTYYDLLMFKRQPLIIVPAVGLFTVFLSMWVSFIYQAVADRLTSTSQQQFWRRLVPMMRIYTAVGSTVFFIFRLILLATWDGGHKGLFQVVKSKLPVETCMALFLFPIIFSGIFREVDVRIVLCLWLATIIAMFVAVYLAHAELYYTFTSVYIVPSLVIIFETYRYNKCKNLINMVLQKIVKEKDDNADQIHATEMRHMIANVAHDLKTVSALAHTRSLAGLMYFLPCQPLTSFLSGIEVISDIALECKCRVKENRLSPAQFIDDINSVLNCVNSIRNTNSFMLMTINRCIDYTKASKGFKLVPRQETIDLMEALSLPLNCMKDIQQRVPITLEPLPQEICSHIITDKQWLQENVLCLLSNAVKYSTGGEVKVMLTVVRPESDSPEVSYFQRTYASLGISPFKRRKSGLQVVPLDFEHHLHPIQDEEDEQINLFKPVLDDSSQHMTLGTSKSSFVSDVEKTTAPLCTSYICVEVEDNGIGLSKDAMDNLFNPFKQVQRLAGGTGLGLYSLARRVEALSGYYGVRSRRDGKQGSVFWFSLPYRPDRVSALSARKQALSNRGSNIRGSFLNVHLAADSEGNSESFVDLRTILSGDAVDQLTFSNSTDAADVGKTEEGFQTKSNVSQILNILIVDDSPAIVKMISMMLRRLGHRISTAENGAIALQNIMDKRGSNSSDPYDVVLMDLQMPVMDGLEATRRLRHIEASENTLSDHATADSTHQIIIGVSANSDHETMQDALSAGVDAFMGKPFSIETFQKTYEKVSEKAIIRSYDI